MINNVHVIVSIETAVQGPQSVRLSVITMSHRTVLPTGISSFTLRRKNFHRLHGYGIQNSKIPEYTHAKHNI